jgi:glycerophosphoryl diester phosphodiesterase
MAAALLLILLAFHCQPGPARKLGTTAKRQPNMEAFDWQGHRGARGLMPENSVPAFLKALEFPVSTLELDVAISQDSQVVVSHEPWFSHHICSLPEGGAVTEEQEARLLLFQMPYSEIQRYDCGIRGNERFREQQAMPVVKPLLSDVVLAVEAYCRKSGRALPRYNI